MDPPEGTRAQFTAETGIEVDYIEDINTNEELFGKIQAPLSQGQSIDRDIIVPTAWLAARLKSLGYLLPLDKNAIPNIVNLEDTLAHPAWDPNRDYSLPWQTYMTGVGYDPEKVGFEITSVEQLLDPSLKGKITMLDSQEDTVCLFLLAMGSDPTKVDPAAFDEVIAKLQKAVDDDQIRQFTGPGLHGPASKGDVWASIAWSGDILSLQSSNPNLTFVVPDAGGATSVDTMVIPLGGDVEARLPVHELLLPARDHGAGRGVGQLHPTCEGREGRDRRDRPCPCREPAHLPAGRGARAALRVRAGGTGRSRVPGEVAGRGHRVAPCGTGCIVIPG